MITVAPKIDVYTAPSAPARAAQPAVYTQTGETAAHVAQISQQAQHLGTQWATIAGNLKAQSDQLDFLQAKADYEAGIAQANLDISRDPETLADPLSYESKLKSAESEAATRIPESLKSREAAGMFEAYRQRQVPEDLVKGRAAGLKMLDNKNAAQFVVEKDRLAKQAGEAATPQDFRENVALFEGLVTRMESLHILTPAQKEHELITFKMVVAENNMRSTGEQDPARMRSMAAEGTWSEHVPESKRIAIFEHVETRQHVAETRAREKFNEVKRVYVDGLEAQANFGLLTQAAITNGQKGLDPIHPDPKDWNRLADLNEKAPGLSASDGGGMRSINAIYASYATLREPTKQDAQNALDQLNSLRSTGGLSERATNHLITASNHIQGRVVALEAQERQIEAAARAARGEERTQENFQKSQLNQKVHDAQTEFEGQYKRSPLAGIVGKLNEQKRIKMRSDLETLIRNNPNMPIKDAIERVLGTPAQQKDQATPDGVDDLMRKR